MRQYEGGSVSRESPMGGISVSALAFLLAVVAAALTKTSARADNVIV